MSFSTAYTNKEASYAQQVQQEWLRRKRAIEEMQYVGGARSGDRPEGSPTTANLGIDGVGSLASGGGLSPSQAGLQSVNSPITSAALSAGQTAEQGSRPAITSTDTRQGLGQISDDLVVKPGQYYSDVNALNINALIQDPNQAMNYWSRHQGYNDAFGKRVAGTFNIPGLLQAMGVGQGANGSQLTGTNALDWYGRLADRMSGRLTDGGNNQYLNPQSIVSNIFNTPKFGTGTDAGVSDLSLRINNPGLQPEQQVSNVAEYVLGSLQGVLTNEQIEAYATILDQYATDYMRMYQTTPGGVGDLTFLDFIRQNTNQFGGMF